MSGERDGRGGEFAADLAFPMVADFADFDEFGYHGGDHPVAAMRATHGHGEGTDTRELGRTGLYVHGLGLPVIHIHACRIKRASWRRRDPLVKLWWLQR